MLRTEENQRFSVNLKCRVAFEFVDVFSGINKLCCSWHWAQKNFPIYFPAFLLAAATCAGPGTAMPKCPKCDKEVYFAERVTSLGKDWHRPCLKCEKCGKTLTSGGHAEHEGKPYCNHPCYSAMFGPKGFGRGGAESHTFK